jgi:hypothetical protein
MDLKTLQDNFNPKIFSYVTLKDQFKNSEQKCRLHNFTNNVIIYQNVFTNHLPQDDLIVIENELLGITRPLSKIIEKNKPNYNLPKITQPCFQ